MQCNSSTRRHFIVKSQPYELLQFFNRKRDSTSIIVIFICNTREAVCADTGVSHSVAGQKLCQLLKSLSPEQNFGNDSRRWTDTGNGDTPTVVNINVKGENIPTELMVLKNGRGNGTLAASICKEQR
ncbi:hypothetical protein HNY73_023166 [Argiope bruennichi]|uniref:Uncharacterized protein n=1 Tax=Argiope bruennichi TaxID=94029 RepID=A0A8T0E2Z1_ARGBR|nr:hypothetical protein HNY73_023166 [Argiope bruennichi]